MSFTERDVTVMQSKLKAVCGRVRKLIMVRKSVATYRLEGMNHLRALEQLAAWSRSYGFDLWDVYSRQWRPSSHGRVCLGDDPKHSQIDVDSDCQLPPTPQETTESM